MSEYKGPQGTAKPSIGRIVHYVYKEEKHPPETWPAIIIGVHPDGMANIFIFSHKGAYPIPAVAQAIEPTPGCWNWPPRIP